jgi:hypothetical protein
VEPGPKPPQVEPIPTQADTVQKVSAIRREVGRVFQEEEDKAWLLASASIICRETSLLYCRLRMKASHESPTCGTFLVVS